MIKSFEFGVWSLVGWLAFTAPAFAIASDAPAAANPRYVFTLTYSAAEEAIGEALRQKGAGDKIAAYINNSTNEPLYSYDQPLTVEIRGLQFEQKAHRWNASLVFISNGEVVSALPAAGRFDEMVELPVLKHEVRSGEVIGKNDIEIHDFSQKQIRTDTITDLAALIGKSPIRTISASRPVREHEIASPAIIKKNGLVQVHYTAPGMLISTSGQAMMDGAKGDVIDVRNTTSRKILRAVIEDANTVSIITPTTQTSQVSGGTHVTN